MPPVDIPWKGFHIWTLSFSSSNYSFVFLVYTRRYLCSSSLSSFLLIHFYPFFPCVWRLLCLRLAFNGGSAGRTTKPQDAHTQPWYTLYSINSARSHAQEAHTRTIPCWQISPKPPPRQPERMTVLHCLKHFQLFRPGLITEWLSATIPHRSGSTKRRW